MIGAALVLLALGTPAQTTLSDADRTRISSDVATSEPAGKLDLTPIDAERGTAEFMAVCVRSAWDMAKTAEAATRSDLGYAKDVELAHSGRWFSKRAYLALETAPSASAVGEGLPQCLLSVGSVQPRTSLQLAQLLKAALDAELGRELPILQNDDLQSYLEWVSDGSGMTNRVTVDSIPTPTYSITYLFERWSPHGVLYRRELRRAFSESQKK